MQQTEKYKLNLIETSDTFSPNPLNENAQKLEAALDIKANAADHAALEQRVQALELHHFAAGTYTGDGNASQFIALGFTPEVVMIHPVYLYEKIGAMCVKDYPHDGMVIVPGGFEVSRTYGGPKTLAANNGGTQYRYVAIC